MPVAETMDGHYIGSPDRARALCDERGIWPELREPYHNVCSIGFCPAENKWYGWSHRAIYGFGIGSRVKHGDCAYVADTPEGLIEDYVAFYSDVDDAERSDLRRKECQILPDRSGVRILHAPLDIPMAESIEQAMDSDTDPSSLEMVDIHKDAVTIELCGRGEWTAKTLEDARQMACDFAEDVA